MLLFILLKPPGVRRAARRPYGISAQVARRSRCASDFRVSLTAPALRHWLLPRGLVVHVLSDLSRPQVARSERSGDVALLWRWRRALPLKAGLLRVFARRRGRVCVRVRCGGVCAGTMPHGSGGDDLASSDEIKVFKDEGEEEKRSSENLTDLKSSLVTEGEEVSAAVAAARTSACLAASCHADFGVSRLQQDASTARGLTPTSGLCRFLQEKIVGLPGQATSGYASPKPTRSDAFGSLFGE